MSLCHPTQTQKAAHVQAMCRNVIGNRGVFVFFADRLLFSYLLTSILFSPACCTPISPLLLPASMSSQVRGYLVYKRPGEFASQEAHKCIKRTLVVRILELRERGSIVNSAKAEEKKKSGPTCLMESRSGASSFPPLSHLYKLCFDWSIFIISTLLRFFLNPGIKWA